MQDYMKLAKQMIEANKPLSKIQSALTQHYKQEHQNQFYADMRVEYDGLYPAFRDMTEEEVMAYDTENFNEDNVKPGEFEYPKIAIDYSEDETYVTFEEYKNEAIVIQEAVEATYDEDGITVLTEAIAEVTEQVRPYVPVEPTEEDIDTLLNSISEYKEYIKAEKESTKEAIKVEHSSVVYDGDFTSINYMSATVAVANHKMLQAMVQANPDLQPVYDAVYKSTVGWKGADNEVHTVQLESLSEALEKNLLEIKNVIGA